jgi:type I restriction enzyme S subunit
MYPIWPKEFIRKSYLYYFMQSPMFVNEAVKCSMRTGLPKINRQDLNRIKINFPTSLSIQKEIVDTLEQWDTAIEKTEALIDAKERQFGWLVTRLLDNKSNDQSWDQYSFRDIFSPFKEVNKSNEDLEVLSVTKDGIVSQSEYFNKEIASEDKSKYLIVRRGSLVMSGLNFWMGSIDFQDIRDVGIVSPAYKTFKINSGNFDERYLRFFVRSKYMRKILIGASVQGASVVRRNLDMDMLVNSAIHLPQIQKQKEIAELLGAAEKEINLLKKLADQYRTQKRGLMQKLLSGEWHIKNKEAA